LTVLAKAVEIPMELEGHFGGKPVLEVLAVLGFLCFFSKIVFVAYRNPSLFWVFVFLREK
jgi:hypothetical protein